MSDVYEYRVSVPAAIEHDHAAQRGDTTLTQHPTKSLIVPPPELSPAPRRDRGSARSNPHWGLRFGVEGENCNPTSRSVRTQPQQGPGKSCSPRHRMASDSRNQGFQMLMMTWRAHCLSLLVLKQNAREGSRQ